MFSRDYFHSAAVLPFIQSMNIKSVLFGLSKAEIEILYNFQY